MINFLSWLSVQNIFSNRFVFGLKEVCVEKDHSVLIDSKLNFENHISGIVKLKLQIRCLVLSKDRDVNETLGSETETRPRRLIFSPRRDRDRDLPTLCRDRDETETFKF